MASCPQVCVTRRHGRGLEAFMVPKSEATMPKVRPASTGPALLAATPIEGRSKDAAAISKMASRGGLLEQVSHDTEEDGPRSARVGS